MSHDISKALTDYVRHARDYNSTVDKIDNDLTNYGLNLHRMKEVVFFDYDWIDYNTVKVTMKKAIDSHLNRLYFHILSFTHLGTGPSTTFDANDAYDRAMRGI